MKNYIVYEFFIVETGEIFYVGQGKVGRNKVVGKGERNKDFDRIYETYKCDSRILYDQLTQEESWEIEKRIIKEYRQLGYPLTNKSSGGRYAHEGIDYSGEKNPMYGISPQQRMDEETYKQWLHKQKTRERRGEKNPNYGNTTLHEKYLNDPQLAKQKQSRPGKQNGRCVAIALYKDGEFVRSFDYKKECAEYLIQNRLVRAKTVNAVLTKMQRSIKNDIDYYGFKFKILQ